MESSSLKKRILKFCDYFEMRDLIDPERIKNEDDFRSDVRMIFKENPRIFSNFLSKVFDSRIRFVLQRFYSIEGFESEKPISNVLPYKYRVEIIRTLKRETELVFPRPVLSKISLIIQVGLFIVPMLLFLFFFVVNFEFVIVTHGFLRIGALFICGSILNVVAYLCFPNFFRPSKFPGVHTYKDLLDDVVLLNRYDFIEDEYALTLNELERVLN